jgi:hypothetical protein
MHAIGIVRIEEKAIECKFGDSKSVADMWRKEWLLF